MEKVTTTSLINPPLLPNKTSNLILDVTGLTTKKGLLKEGWSSKCAEYVKKYLCNQQ